MTTTSEQTIIDKFRRYIIAPSSVLIGLGVLRYTVEYSMSLYSDSDVGYAIQVFGLGLFVAPVMMILAIDEWVEDAGISHADMEKDDEDYSVSKFWLAASLFQLIVILSGLVMLVVGHFI